MSVNSWLRRIRRSFTNFKKIRSDEGITDAHVFKERMVELGNKQMAPQPLFQTPQLSLDSVAMNEKQDKNQEFDEATALLDTAFTTAVVPDGYYLTPNGTLKKKDSTPINVTSGTTPGMATTTMPNTGIALLGSVSDGPFGVPAHAKQKEKVEKKQKEIKVKTFAGRRAIELDDTEQRETTQATSEVSTGDVPMVPSK